MLFWLHGDVICEALKRDINVFSEKPISTTFEGLERIKHEYSKTEALLTTMFGLRYTPWFLTAHNVIKSGSIGEVRLMQAQKSYKLGRRGDVYRKRKTYGGTIPWVGSHGIDWLYWLGGEKFVSVYHLIQRSSIDRGYGDLETSALCQFTFTNDVFASVSIDYLRPETAFSHADDRIRIAGSGGVLEIRDEKVYLINDTVEGMQVLPLVKGQNIFTNFVGQIRGEGRCMDSAKDAFIVTEACLKARLSADEKNVIFF